jgi:ribosomal protein S8
MGDLNSILKSFKVQKNLNPKIWEKSENGIIMNSKVRTRLLEIAHDFIEFLNVDFVISDIVMTGSLSNYNWSKYSDVDIHILADFNQFSDVEKPLYEELFFLKKSLYNDKHDLKIFGYDVENYVEDSSLQKKVKGIGIYSVLHNEWVSKPSRESVDINYEQISTKVRQWMKIIDGIVDNTKDEDIETSKNIIKKCNDKLRKYRESGLHEGGEYSEENLVFKVLRRNGYLQKIRSLSDKLVDKKLSLKESLNNGSKLGNFTIISDNTMKGHGGRKLKNWQSDNAWDLKAPIGTSVFSFTKGVVSHIRQSPPNNVKIYGTQVSIRGVDDNPDIFYTHLEGVKIKSGDKVNVGDYIGKITKWPTYPSESHVHVGLPYGKDLGQLVTINKIDMKKFETNKDSSDEKVTDDDDLKDNLNKTFDDLKDDTPIEKPEKKQSSSLTGALLKVLGFN